MIGLILKLENCSVYTADEANPLKAKIKALSLPNVDYLNGRE